MDAVKFIEERNRMCKSFDNYCYDCPAWYGSCKLGTGTHLECEADKAVKIVEDWSATHPRKTRQSVFLEQYPNAESDHQGILIIDPCDVDKTMHGKDGDCYNGNCDDCCAKFWAQEVE